MNETEPVRLACGFCGHWEKGQRTKEQIAQWLRVHRNAQLGTYAGELELASICPHPCTEETAEAVPADLPGIHERTER